jgi:hypothetical protein
MRKEKKPAYGWVKRLVNKITKSNAPLNNSFEYYGYQVEQYSGTVDYTSVTIFDKGRWRRELVEFDFDFWTKKLHFCSYIDDDFRMAVVKAFVEYYDDVNVSDDTLDERRKEYQEYLDNPDEYVEEAVKEAKRQMEIIDSLPIDWVNKNDLKK